MKSRETNQLFFPFATPVLASVKESYSKKSVVSFPKKCGEEESLRYMNGVMERIRVVRQKGV